MSQENVELVRTIYEAVARRDTATPFEFYAEDIVWDLTKTNTASLLTTTVARGHEGVREVWREGSRFSTELLSACKDLWTQTTGCWQ